MDPLSPGVSHPPAGPAKSEVTSHVRLKHGFIGRADQHGAFAPIRWVVHADRVAVAPAAINADLDQFANQRIGDIAGAVADAQQPNGSLGPPTELERHPA